MPFQGAFGPQETWRDAALCKNVSAGCSLGLGGQELVHLQVVHLHLAVESATQNTKPYKPINPKPCSSQKEPRRRRGALPGHRLKEAKVPPLGLLEDHLQVFYGGANLEFRASGSEA